MPYVTFPGAGRRGTTVIDRATAYPVFGWRAGRVAAEMVRAGEVDLVHALGASGLGYAMARRGPEGRAPFVFNPQGLEEFGGTHPGFARLKRLAYTPLQAAVRRCAQAADAILATDHALVAPVRTHLAVDPARVHVVPNAVDLETIDRARASAAATAATLRDPARAGRWRAAAAQRRPARGEQGLPRAGGRARGAQGARRQRRRAGAGCWSATARIAPASPARSTPPGWPRMSTWPDAWPRASCAGWYAAADVFVHPTLYEGSSLVTLEAMAHGKPVVATRAGGLPDKVRPGETGWLVEPGASSALAGALAESLGEPADTLARFGAAGRRLVEEAFAWPVVAAQLEALYAALLSRRDTERLARFRQSPADPAHRDTTIARARRRRPAARRSRAVAAAS